MIGPLEALTAFLIALAIVGGVVRLVLRRRAAPDTARGPVWRFTVLIGLQVVAGLLLHLTLFPPTIAKSPGRLIVATRGSGPIAPASGDMLVALPEAGAAPGATRVPDLGSALRLYEDYGRLRIEGHGLTSRDQIPLDRPAEFAPSAPPRGLIELATPVPIAPGARFTTSGQVGTLPAGTVELLDPAGAVVDRAFVTANTRFTLTASVRAAGLALFSLRLLDATGRPVEQVDVPVETRAQPQPRVLVLAGAPSPETKYLRRWAQDAGVALGLEMDLGAATVLGDPPTPLTRASLADIDLVVVDDRRWETLPRAARAALEAAVREGLGLLLRPTGPLTPMTQREWSSLGAPLSVGGDIKPFRLSDGGLDAAPELNRLDLAPARRDQVRLLNDRNGAPLATWRPYGQGRVGFWAVADSHTLPLRGHPDRYGELWSELFSGLARPVEGPRVRLTQIARAGERAVLCPLAYEARVYGPTGAEERLQRDPATDEAACAAYWPTTPGWRRLHVNGQQAAFYVHPAEAARSLAHAANRRATLELVEQAAVGTATGSVGRGSPWPWAATLLLVLGALWWLERRSQRATP